MSCSVKAVLAVLVVSLLSFPAPALPGWFADNLIDPGDGKLDASDYLASAHGFLPVPIIITEPAIGYGLGLAVAYFHPPKQQDYEDHPHRGPPSISVGLGAKTDNGTYMYGAAHSGIWKNDHIRYLGAVAEMNINMNWYPEGVLGEIVGSEGVGFNVEGLFLLQQMQVRLKESDWWLGGGYIYVNADNRFDLFDNLPVELPNPQFEFTLGSVSAFIEYDDTNSTFTPSKGLSGKLEIQNFNKSWGSDFEYNHYTGELKHYTPFGDYSSLGLKLKAATVNGDVPFFAYPFVQLRGIPALRYQGQSTVTAEAEYLWGITPRWSLVFFGGVGYTSAIEDLNGESHTVAAGGLGFRYRLARKLGLQSGIDIAHGPEDTSFYITVGSAWR